MLQKTVSKALLKPRSTTSTALPLLTKLLIAEQPSTLLHIFTLAPTSAEALPDLHIFHQIQLQASLGSPDPICACSDIYIPARSPGPAFTSYTLIFPFHLFLWSCLLILAGLLTLLLEFLHITMDRSWAWRQQSLKNINRLSWIPFLFFLYKVHLLSNSFQLVRYKIFICNNQCQDSLQECSALL